MKKKLLCLLLCFAMLLSVCVGLTSCSNSTDDTKDDTSTTDNSERNTMTLSMFVVTENKVNYTADELAALSATERAKAEERIAAYKAVSDAINKLTKSKYKTQLDLHFLTEDEYYTVVENRLRATEEEAALAEAAAKALKKYIKEQKNAGNTDTEMVQSQFYELYPQYAKYQVTTVAEGEEAVTTTEETVLNEFGVAELKYPEAKENAVDILFLSGVDRYKEYVANEWLLQLDEELTGSSKKLKDYIFPEFLSSAKTIGSGTYAIPNNVIIGQYTYLLLDKELLSKYYYDTTTISSLTDITDFMADIVSYEKDVIPFKGSAEVYNVHYWNIDPDTYTVNPFEFSIIGNAYTNAATLGTNLAFKSLFKEKNYTSQLLTLKLFEEKGYFVENAKETDRFAATVVKGGAELEEVYGDKYLMVPLEVPRADEATLFGGMFGVGGYATNVARCMEIITFLNTNSEFRNLLQYGISGVNYTVKEDGTVERLNDNYMMDIKKTGNVFIAYPEEGMSANAWKYGTQQNLDAKVYPTVGFTFSKDEPLDTNLIKLMAQYSKEIKARLDACKTYDELSALLTSLDSELNASVAQVKRSDATVMKKNVYLYTQAQINYMPAGVSFMKDASGSDIQTPYMYYYSWLDSNGFIRNDM